MPAIVEIVADPAQRLVRFAQQDFFLFRSGADFRRPRISRRHPSRRLRVTIDQTKNAVEKARAAFDSLLVPLQIFFRRRGE